MKKTPRQIAERRNDFVYSLQKMNADINIQRNNNAGFASQVIVNQLSYGSDFMLNLADAEQMLRDMNSRVFLLGLPLEFYKNDELEIFYPGTAKFQTGYKPYALWVCMNGKAEAEKMMIEQGFNAIDNMVRLHNCGFLTYKK